MPQCDDGWGSGRLQRRNLEARSNRGTTVAGTALHFRSSKETLRALSRSRSPCHLSTLEPANQRQIGDFQTGIHPAAPCTGKRAWSCTIFPGMRIGVHIMFLRSPVFHLATTGSSGTPSKPDAWPRLALRLVLGFRAPRWLLPSVVIRPALSAARFSPAPARLRHCA